MEQQYEEMQLAKKRFWRILLPLLVYLGVRYLGNLIAEMFVIALNVTDILDIKAISAMGMEEQLEFIRQLSTDATTYAKMAKIFIENTMLISAIVAAVALPVGLIFFLVDRNREKKVGALQVRKEPVWKYPLMVLLGVALCIALNVILLMCDQVFFQGMTSQSLSATYASPMVLQLIGVGVFVPFSEEFFYRGVLYNRYRENGPYMRAAVYTSILFAIAHGSMIQMIYAMILGMVLAYAYEKFGSIAAPITMHIAVNVTSVILTNEGGFAWLLANPMRAGVVTVVCAFVGSSVIVYLQSLKGREDLNSNTNGENIETT